MHDISIYPEIYHPVYNFKNCAIFRLDIAILRLSRYLDIQVRKILLWYPKQLVRFLNNRQKIIISYHRDKIFYLKQTTSHRESCVLERKKIVRRDTYVYLSPNKETPTSFIIRTLQTLQDNMPRVLTTHRYRHHTSKQG